MDLRRRIAKEYDEPCKDVIKGFVDMGYSLTMIGSTLGISKHTVKSLCVQYGIKPNARMELRPECRGVGTVGKRVESCRATMRKRMIPNELILAEVLKHPTARKFMKDGKYALDTVYKRWDTFGEALTEARKLSV